MLKLIAHVDNKANPFAKLSNKPDLRQAGNTITASAALGITMSRDAFGGPFAPLRSGEARRPLIKTGRLLNSFRSRVSGHTLTVWNATPYSAKQNERRRFLDASAYLHIVAKSCIRLNELS